MGDEGELPETNKGDIPPENGSRVQFPAIENSFCCFDGDEES